MLVRFLKLMLLCILLCSKAFAQVEIKRVAVLEFRGVAIEEAMLLKLSDQARSAAVDTLSKEEYLIMTRENMMQVLSDMGKDASCIEGSCEVELGRNIGADLIITGDILKIDASYVLTLKLYETKTGGLLKIKEVEQEGLLPLKNETYTQSMLLLQEGLDVGVEEKKSWQGWKKDRSSEKVSKKKSKKGKEEAPRTKPLKIARGLMIAAGTTYVLTGLTRLGYAASNTLGDARTAYQSNHRLSSTTATLTLTAGIFYVYGKNQQRKAEEEE